MGRKQARVGQIFIEVRITASQGLHVPFSHIHVKLLSLLLNLERHFSHNLKLR